MEYVIVVAFLLMGDAKSQDMYAFIGYPFPDMVTCKAFAAVNYDLAANISAANYNRPLEEIENIYCAPKHEVMALAYGKAV